MEQKLYKAAGDVSKDDLDIKTIALYQPQTGESKEDLAALARKYGIYALGVFGQALAQSVDIPFFVILQSEDAIEKFSDMQKYAADPRYLHIKGKPVIGLCDPQKIPNAAAQLTAWREEARNQGIGEVLFWVCTTDDGELDKSLACAIDAEFEYHTVASDYAEQVESAKYTELESSHPVYRGTAVCGEKADLFYRWNRIAVNFTRRNFPVQTRFLFVSLGKEGLTDTTGSALFKALVDLPYDEKTPLLIGGGQRKESGWDKALDEQTQIAVQIHLFYLDLIDELISRLVSIQHPFDLYITTDSVYKAEHIRRKFAEARCLRPCVQAVQVDVCANRGRDVMPFLEQLRPVYDRYKYFCHIHTKKSKHSNEGNLWRQFLYKCLLGSQSVTDDILCLLESDPTVGVVCPRAFEEIFIFMEWGKNKEKVLATAEKIGIEIDENTQQPVFPAGDMFWARTEAVHQLLSYPFTEDDIPPEEGQLDGTLMHAIERLWSFVAKHNGFRTVFIDNIDVQGSGEGDTAVRAELSRIKNKKLWRLSEKIYSVADKLLPFGTRRRAFVKRLLNPFKK